MIHTSVQSGLSTSPPFFDPEGTQMHHRHMTLVFNRGWQTMLVMLLEHPMTDLPGSIPQHNWNLNKNSDSSKECNVFVQWMAKSSCKTRNTFQPSIDSLVSQSGMLHGMTSRDGHNWIRSACMVWLTMVSFVCLNHLSIWMQIDQPVLECFDVGPCATRVRTIDPHNQSGLDTNGNFTSHTRIFELVGIPLAIWWPCKSCHNHSSFCFPI